MYFKRIIETLNIQRYSTYQKEKKKEYKSLDKRKV